MASISSLAKIAVIATKEQNPPFSLRCDRLVTSTLTLPNCAVYIVIFEVCSVTMLAQMSVAALYAILWYSSVDSICLNVFTYFIKLGKGV